MYRVLPNRGASVVFSGNVIISFTLTLVPVSVRLEHLAITSKAPYKSGLLANTPQVSVVVGARKGKVEQSYPED